MIVLEVGTRPEIVKMAPVIRACRARRLPHAVVHTGQHYDHALSGVFFEQLELPLPDRQLEVGSGTREEHLKRTREGVRKVLRELGARLLLVQGDTNSVLGAARAARDLGVPVGHVEAGLRCGDLRMAEERNRIETDRIASRLYAPTPGARVHLLAEGVPVTRVAVTGNTVVDELQRQLERLPSRVPQGLGVEPGGYLLATVHRRENVEDDAALAEIFRGLAAASAQAGRPVLAALHPRTRQRLAELDPSLAAGVRVLPPLGYLEFLALQRDAALLLSDSGGVQEEGCALHVPCVVLRDSTERPESVEVGAALLAGASAERIVAAAEVLLARPRRWANPFGDGKAGERIAASAASILAGARRCAC